MKTKLFMSMKAPKRISYLTRKILKINRLKRKPIRIIKKDQRLVT